MIEIERSPLPQGYVLKQGTLIEDFENVTDWSKGGAVINDLLADPVHYRTGSAGLKLQVNDVGVGKFISATKYMSPIKINPGDVIHIWIYIPDMNPGENIKTIEVLLSSHSSGTWTHYFSVGWVPALTAGSGFTPGWNHRTIQASAMVNNGGESWDNPMQGIRLRNWTQDNKTGYVTFDNMFFRQASVPRLVLSFDDGYDTVYSVAFNKMNPLGLRATVYVTRDIITGDRPSNYGPPLTPEHINEMYEAGWAIGNHTLSHADLSTLSQAQIEDELMGCYDWMLSNGWTRCANHVAYPYGTVLTQAMLDAMAATYMVTGRTTLADNSIAGLDPTPVGNLYCLRSNSLGIPVSLATVQSYINTAIARQSTINWFGHALENGHATGCYWGATDFNSLVDFIMLNRIPCVTIDEWYRGLTNPRYSSLPVDR